MNMHKIFIAVITLVYQCECNSVDEKRKKTHNNLCFAYLNLFYNANDATEHRLPHNDNKYTGKCNERYDC